jgi:hypothetical protein
LHCYFCRTQPSNKFSKEKRSKSVATCHILCNYLLWLLILRGQQVLQKSFLLMTLQYAKMKELCLFHLDHTQPLVFSTQYLLFQARAIYQDLCVCTLYLTAIQVTTSIGNWWWLHKSFYIFFKLLWLYLIVRC